MDFARGLNVICGDNVTGKTYLFKFAYAVTKSLRDGASLPFDRLPQALTNKLEGVFRPGSLGCLAHRAPYPTTVSVATTCAELADALLFTFASRGSAAVEVTSVPSAQEIGGPTILVCQKFSRSPHRQTMPCTPMRRGRIYFRCLLAPCATAVR